MTLSAINVSAIALFIAGGLSYAYSSLLGYLEEIESGFEVRFAIVDGATKDQIAAAAKRLRSEEGVEKVVFLPKENEWKKFRQEKGWEDLFSEEENPLPDSFSVRFSDLSKADGVVLTIKSLEIYNRRDEIRDPTNERRFVLNLMGFVRLLGVILGAVTVFTAGTLIFNTVQMAVLARRQEIRIMRLVGASHWTIRWPFLLEGAIEGLVGGLLGGLLLWAFVFYLQSQLAQTFPLGVGEGGSYPGLWMMLALGVAGSLLGMLSAGLSVRRHLGGAR